MTLCLGRAGDAAGADAKTVVAFQMLEEYSPSKGTMTAPRWAGSPRVRLLS